MRYKILLPLLLLPVFSNITLAQDKPAVYLLRDRETIRFVINPIEPLDPSVETQLNDIHNYKLYEIESPDDPDLMRGNDVTTSFIDQTALPRLMLRGTRIEIDLVRALDFGKTYVLKVIPIKSDSSPSTSVRFDVKPAADILPSLDASRIRKELRVQSQVPITTGQQVTKINVERKTLRKASDSTKVKEHFTPFTASSDPGKSSSANDLTLTLDKSLKEAQDYQFLVRSGITDILPSPNGPLPTTITAKGTVKIPGLPSPPDDPKIDFKLASVAAVSQKPEFDLVAKLATPSIIKVTKDRKENWYFEPQAAIDVGLGPTKSSNSVIINLPFRKFYKYPLIPCPKPQCVGCPIPSCEERQRNKRKMDAVHLDKGDIKTPTFYGWSQVPWYRLGSIKTLLSPFKLETDRKFQRINTLGNMRFEFNFHRGLASIKDKRTLLAADLQDKADMVEINDGFKIVPFLSFDFGGHIKNETVKNTKKNASEMVPRHGIFRTYVGFQPTIQWQMLSFPMSFGLDESLVIIANREIIGLVTDNGVGFRRIRGIHHRGLASWDVYFDPAKRYSFNITYENGRLAPDFNYLNKLSTGFRVRY